MEHATDATAAILATLRRHGLVPDASGWRVELLPGGLNSRVFVARDPAGAPALTVRQARPGLEHVLDREAWVLATLAGPRGCAPWPARRVGDLLAHDYADGEPAPLGEVSAAARAALGGCLARIHAHERPGYTRWPSPARHDGTLRDFFHARLDMLAGYPAMRGLLAAAGRPFAAALRALPLTGDGWDGRRFAITHGDLSVGNILWRDPAVTLIDWEYSRDGDPAEDLAYLLGEQPVSAARWDEIAGAYTAAGGASAALARMRAYLPFVLLDSAVWWAGFLGAADAPEVSERLHRGVEALGLALDGGERGARPPRAEHGRHRNR